MTKLYTQEELSALVAFHCDWLQRHEAELEALRNPPTWGGGASTPTTGVTQP